MENGTDNKIVELFGPKVEPKDTQAIDEKMQDAWTPGVEVEFDPDQADDCGAFQEDALSEEDAKESSIDVLQEG